MNILFMSVYVGEGEHCSPFFHILITVDRRGNFSSLENVGGTTSFLFFFLYIYALTWAEIAFLVKYWAVFC